MRTATFYALPEDTDNDINLTPMLDVVFIMLIFFIVTASFVREAGIDVNRPEGDVQTVPSDNGILIIIEPNNEIRMGNRFIDPRALRANIERASAEKPAATVVIQAAASSETDMLVRVMDASRAAGVYEIAIADRPNR